jgi:hypothetical protein
MSEPSVSNILRYRKCLSVYCLVFQHARLNVYIAVKAPGTNYTVDPLLWKGSSALAAQNIFDP